MNRLKPLLRKFPPYLWVANQYRTLRRLTIYPETARVGVTGNYDAYWDTKLGLNQGRMSPFRQARAEAIASLVQPGVRVLELGIGDGAMLKYLVDTCGVQGKGLDISPQAVEFCQKQGLDVELADVNAPLGAHINDHYDVIVMAEIIEHLPDPEAVLERLRDKADLLIISIPNTGYHQHRLRLMMGRFPLQWVVTPGEHLRFWTVVDFRWWVAQLDFDLTAVIAYRGTPGLRQLWPNLFGQAMVYAMKSRR